jgi:hypothetical protein
MKKAFQGVIAIALVCGALVTAQESNRSDQPIISVLKPTPTSEPVLLQEPAAPLSEPSTPAEITLAAPMSSTSCDAWCVTPCCCPAPCVPTVFCLVDPCGCSHEACVEVPVCCAGQQPSVCWRDGLFGRQVAMLCWTCCDFEAKVIVTRNGKVRVRD